MIGAGCKPNCCTQPRAAPWGNDVALIKVSRSVRATCFMRGNAPCGVKGINGLRAFGAWHFCVGAKMPNVSIAVYVSPGRCPGLWATFGLTARPNHLPGVCANWFVFNRRFLAMAEYSSKLELCSFGLTKTRIITNNDFCPRLILSAKICASERRTERLCKASAETDKLV